jgi:hypothetical protein
MKSPFNSITRCATVLAALAFAATVLPAQPEGGSTARTKFSDPAKPGVLKLSLPWAEVRVTGTDDNEIVVSSTLDQKGRSETDDEGFRRLDEETTFELVEENNVATVRIAGDNAWAAHGAEFEIRVPRSTSLVIRNQAGGDIAVEGVEGDLDINSMNGEVRLVDIASSAVVNTMNGEIRATFKRAPAKPVSISTLNGEIDVRLPGDTKANLRMRTHNGSIRTNFSDQVLQTKTEKTTGRFTVPTPVAHPGEAVAETDREQARLDREQAKSEARAAREAAKEAVKEAARIAAEVARNINVDVDGDGTVAIMPPVPPMPVPGFGGKTIVGTLNGGGVDIKLTSMNGAITLRQAN